MECGVSEGAQSPSLGLQNFLHREPWERGHQPSSEKMRMEEICMATGLSVRYETLGPDSWDLILA